MVSGSRAEKIAIVVTPLVAMATLAIGLQVGARSAERGAIVYGAPRARGSSVFAWQLVNVLDDRGVRESVPATAITVVARGAGGEATWTGATNADGVAEITLDMPWAKPGDAVDLVATEAGRAPPLGRGAITWGYGSREEVQNTRDGSTDGARDAPAFVRPSKREGDVRLDVAIVGGALVPGFPTSTWVRAIDAKSAAPIADASIDVEAEPGLSIAKLIVTTCENGWAEVVAQPQIHVIGLSLHAHARDGKTGEWAGAPPVAPGASHVTLPASIDENTTSTIEVVAPSAREIIYVEVDDERGRAFAAALGVKSVAGSVPRGTLDLPPMREGLHWLVTSGEPRGAESLRGAAIALPFWVERASGDPAARRKRDEPCALGPFLATHPAAAFPRWIALDGFVGRKDANSAKHFRGLVIAMGSIGIAAVLELLLILRGVARTRADLARIASALDDDDARVNLSRRTSAGSLVIGILVALLGFGLLASLLTWNAT